MMCCSKDFDKGDLLTSFVCLSEDIRYTDIKPQSDAWGLTNIDYM